MEVSGRVYTPGQAAAVLGVTTQSLRRYADDYAEVFEPVVQHGKQRVFDDLILNRLRSAQGLQQQGVAGSIKAGLEMVRDGTSDIDGIALPAATPFEQLVLERLDALAEMVVQLSEENRVLQRNLTAHQIQDTRATPQATVSSSLLSEPELPDPVQHGPLTKAAMRFERLWQRMIGRP